jgi:hypothetical protein
MKAQHRTGLALLASVLMASASLGGQDAARDSLVYRTPAGVIFTVTADGLASVRLGERELATGGWRAASGEGILNCGSLKVDAEQVLKKSLEILGERQARVRHEHKDLAATYDYAFEGEDCRVAARIENRHPTEPLAATWFRGLTLDFGRVPTGRMPTWHGSYLAAHGPSLCHPSFAVRVGASHAVGDGFGVSLAPLGPGLLRSLVWWDCVDWNPGKREALPQRRVSWLVAEPVPPLGARTFVLGIRVSPNGDWRHLLEPYRQHLAATLGPGQYKPDHRVMVQSCVNASVAHMTPENPYGFHGGFRRLDLAQGVAAFCDLLIPDLQKVNGQGVLFWGQGGENPRGAMYRPDFDILPPEVEAQWPTLARRFADARLHLGVCARPGEVAYRHDWKTDGTLRIHADDPAHLEMMGRRFQAMAARGVSAYYLDTFGSDLNDVRAMRDYRRRLGPDVPTYVEHAADAILPFSGLYTELSFDKKTAQYGLAWMDVETWDTFRWLVPGVTSVVVSRVEPKDLPPGAEPPFRFLFRHHMTPLVADWLLRGHVPELKALADEYLDANGQWKK